MIGEDGTGDPRLARRKDPEGVHAHSWGRTLDEMQSLAEDRRSDGWEAVTVVAAHTDTVSRDMGDHERFGLVHIIPNNHAERFQSIYDEDVFTDYLIYANEVDSFMYVVLELIDPDDERSIFLASRYDLVMSRGMVESAHDEGVLYSHVKTIDGTILASIPFEDFDPFVTPPQDASE